MKNKIIYTGVGIIALLIGLLTEVTGEIVLLIVKPFELIGNLLRDISVQGGFLNILSVFVFILLLLIPIAILTYKVIHKAAKIPDYIFLVFISLFTGLSIYGYINPHILLNQFADYNILVQAGADITLFEIIVNSFYVVILYLIILLYLVIKTISNKRLNINKTFKVLIDVIVCIYIFFLFFSIIPSLFNVDFINLNNYEITYEFLTICGEIARYVFMMIIFINLKELIKHMGKEEINQESLKLSKRLYKLSLTLLIVIISTQIIINLYQVVNLANIPNLHAIINLQIDALFISVTFFFLGKYLTRVNNLNEEHNLIV